MSATLHIWVPMAMHHIIVFCCRSLCFLNFMLMRISTRKHKTKLHVDKDLYKEAWNAVQNLIWKKKKPYFEGKLKTNTANPKKLWETLKELGLQNNRSPSSSISKRKMVWHLILLLYLKFFKNSIPILLAI